MKERDSASAGKGHRRLVLLLAALALSGCGKGGAGGMPQPGPQSVGVVTLAPQQVKITTELPGRTSPYRVAEVRPQVSGVILRRLFEEGATVQAGQQLYQIDPAPYQAEYDQAVAKKAADQAQLSSAQVTLGRNQQLLTQKVISQQDFDTQKYTADQMVATVQGDQAAINNAQINLAYTKVFSPIPGRTGRSIVTEGALVTAEQTSPLVIVTQLDPIYVDVTEPSVSLLRLEREIASGAIKKSAGNQPLVKLKLEDGTDYDFTGTLQVSEVTVDQTTGSVTLRAVFPNPHYQLLPGMFVHAYLEEGVSENALLVPQQGVTHNQRGEPTALVVGADNKVEVRVLTADRAIGDKWLVTGGLKAGDKVIVDGIQKARPGSPVNPEEVSTDAPAATPGAGQ